MPQLRLNLPWILMCILCAIQGFSQESYMKTYRAHPIVLKADSLYTFENYEGARQIYQQAGAVFEQSENWAGYVYTLNQLGRTYVQLEQFPEAKNVLETADDLSIERLGGNHLEEARTLQQWGFYYSRVGEDSLATLCLDSALATMTNCCGEQDEALGDLYLDMASYKYSQRENAEREIDLAINKYNESGDSLDFKKSKAYILKGRVLRRKGDTEGAFNYFDAAVQTIDRYEVSPISLRLNAVTFLNSHYVVKHEYEKALETYNELIKLNEIAFGKKSERLITLFTNLGLNYPYINEYGKSIESIRRAIELNHKERKKYLYDLGFAHEAYGRCYKMQKEFDLALRHLELAEKYYEQYHNTSGKDVNIDLSIVHNLMAEICLLDGRHSESIEYVEQALKHAGYQNNLTEQDVVEKNIDLFFNPLLVQGQTYLQLYKKAGDKENLQLSLNTFLNIERIAQATRNGNYSLHTKREVSEHFHRSAKGALHSLHRLNALQEDQIHANIAFDFIEHNRYAELYQNLEKASVTNNLGIPDSLLNKEKSLLSQIENLRRERQDIQDPDSLLAIDKEQIKLQEEYQDLKESLATKYGSYYQIKYDSMLSLQEAQALIDSQAQFFEYLWGDSMISLVSFSRDTAFLEAIPLDSVNNSLERILNWMVTSYPKDDVDMDYETYASLAYQLYHQLVAPFQLTETQKMIISVDGDLAFLPFGTLITDTTPTNFTTAAYLIKEQEIQYAHSANLLLKSHPQVPLKIPHVLAMAYSDKDASPHENSNSQYPEILYSGEEVHALKRELRKGKVKLFTSTDASKSRLMELIDQQDIVHLALHGIGDPQNALNAHLVFRGGINSNESQLYAYELYDLPLSRLRLAVLSACQTGVGMPLPGEGIFSLARGFAYAGTPSIVMSLWKTNDKSTQVVMEHFYHYLNEGRSISKSLQLAKIKYLNESANGKPHFWAAMVPIGQNQILIEPYSSLVRYCILAIVMALAFILMWIRRNRLY